MISGIVFGQSLYVDRLESVWLATQPNNTRVMDKTVKVMAALKKCVCKLWAAYRAVARDANHSLADPRFPSFQKYGVNTIRYETRLGTHLFRGTMGSNKVLVKFCDTCCMEAYKLLEGMNLAP